MIRGSAVTLSVPCEIPDKPKPRSRAHMHVAECRAAASNPEPTVWAQTGIVFYTWWRGDVLPTLSLLPGFRVVSATNFRLIADLAHLHVGDVVDRVKGGHRPYVAYLHGTPVAYGWSALDAASIAEIGLAFGIPAGNRYLWDFATLPAWRGRGIYPRLLQAILEQEAGEVDRFWIGRLPMNLSSARGIQAAGFRCVGTIHAYPGRRPALAPIGTATRARAATVLLNTPFPSAGRYAA